MLSPSGTPVVFEFKFDPKDFKQDCSVCTIPSGETVEGVMKELCRSVALTGTSRGRTFFCIYSGSDGKEEVRHILFSAAMEVRHRGSGHGVPSSELVALLDGALIMVPYPMHPSKPLNAHKGENSFYVRADLEMGTLSVKSSAMRSLRSNPKFNLPPRLAPP